MSEGQCEHEKVYADSMLACDPPKHPWVCRKCRQCGYDQERANQSRGEYERILREKEAGNP